MSLRNRRTWFLVGLAAALAAAALVAALTTGGPVAERGGGGGGFAIGPRHPGQGGGAGVGAGGSSQLQGAQLHSLWWNSTPSDFDRELDLLKDAGADAVRVDISWSSLETDGKGKYASWYVSKADTFLQHAADRGLKVIATLWSTPCWASSAPDDLKQSCTGAWWDRGVDRYAPANPSYYADIAAWVAQRWGGKLAALEVWNEPNLPDQYSLKAADPALADAAMLKAAYPRIKDVAPNLTVLAGALAFSDGAFLQKLYENGIHGYFDGFSIHPYNEWRDPNDAWKTEWTKYTYITGVPWIQSILAAHGDGDKGLWLTELGWSTCGTGSSWCVAPDQQSQYVRDALRIARGWSYVKAALIYNLRNKGTDPTNREDQFGLVNRDFTLKPGYAGFKEGLTSAATEAAPTTPTTTTTPTATTPTTSTPTSSTPAPLPERPAAPDVSMPITTLPAEAAPLPFAVSIPAVTPQRSNEVRVKIRCRPAAAKHCKGVLSLRSTHGRLLARGRVDLKRGVSTARPKLTAAGRRAFAHGARPKVIATVTAARNVRVVRVAVG